MPSKRSKNKNSNKELIEFLIEKTKNVESPLKIRELADEYKQKTRSSQDYSFFCNRISCLAGKVGKMEAIDTVTKVKIMFAIRSAVCTDFLNELRKNARVEVDGCSRIMKYKANDESLNLKQKRSRSEKSKAKKEVIASDGFKIPDSSNGAQVGVHKPLFQQEMPLKRLNHRKSNPEKKLLKFLIERTKNVKSPLKIGNLVYQYNNQNGCRQEYSSIRHRINCLARELENMKAIKRATKIKIIFAVGGHVSMNFLNELRKDAYVEVDEYSRITKYRTNDGSLNLEGKQSKSVKPVAKKYNTRSNVSRTLEFHEIAAVEVPDKPSKRRREIIDYRDPGSVGILNYSQSQLLQEPPREPSNPRIQKLREPKRESEPLETPGAPEPSGHQIKAEPGVNDNYTSKIKFLEAIRSLILSMQMPSLAEILEKTEKMLKECSNELIPNDEMTLTMELLITKMTNNSLANLAENVESVSLRKFFRYLKTAIFTSELGGLENLFGKLYELIKQSALKEKRCPVGKVARALQDTLNNVGLSEVLQADEYYRAWILNEVIRETPIEEAYENTQKLKPNVEYAEFEYWYYRFSNEHHNLING
ncbi:unnamed protein product [Caenorhabditis brenneri]